MPIKSDRWIKEMAIEQEMIVPFEEKQVRKNVISYGLSSYGYDMRISNQFKIFQRSSNAILDPKNISAENFIEYIGDECIIQGIY
jgi:dCTP deaminase